MADNLRRKCLKCGSSPGIDAEIKLYRFPNPGSNNLERCELWAKFCFPDGAWYSVEFQKKLYGEHRMLCNKHFAKTSFANLLEKKINRNAVPDAENQPQPSDSVPEKHENYDDDHNHRSNNSNLSNDDHNYCVKRPEPCPAPKPPRKGFNTEGNESIYYRPNKAIDEAKDEIENAALRELNETDLAEDPIQSDTEDQEPRFSWQAPTQIDVEDNGHHAVLLEGEKSVPKVDEEEVEYKSEQHTGYSCDHCLKDIIGFRYRCVQCDNFDLCHACESEMVHPHHYVLRIPRPTPYEAVNRILEAIRDKIKLLSEEIISDSMDLDEIKQEAPFEEVQVDPFKEVDGIVPETTDIQSEVSEAEIKAETQNILEELTDDFEPIQPRSEDQECVENSETLKRKLRSFEDSPELQALRLKYKKELFDQENNDRHTLKIDELREKYFNEMWLDENEPKMCPDDEVRIRENHPVEWLDESILENEGNICTEAPKTDSSTKLKSSERCRERKVRKTKDHRVLQNILPLLRPKSRRINVLSRSSKFNKPNS